jgi:Zn-dependent protease with chaperone function
MQENIAITKARNTGDTIVLMVCLAIIVSIISVIFIVGLIIAAYATSTGAKEGGLGDFTVNSMVYASVAGGILVTSLVSIRIMRQMFLGNMLQIEYSNYAWLRDWCNSVSRELNMPKVEIFITQDPVMNAFAIGFMRPYNIVLNSGSIRYLTNDELKAIVLHEMGHVYYGHTVIGAYTTVFTGLPVVGGFFGWIINFWSRRAELTADRLALFYFNNPELVKSALIKVHVGPDVAEGFNQIARDWQAVNSANWFNSLSQTLSNHPFLVRRLSHIDQYAKQIVSATTSLPSHPTINSTMDNK